MNEFNENYTTFNFNTQIDWENDMPTPIDTWKIEDFEDIVG